MLTTVHGGLWVPLAWLSLGLDHALWGMDPAGYHLTSVLLHGLAAALVFLVARRLLAAALADGEPGDAPGAGATVGAALAALLFAVHPLRVESVAWVSERRDVLCGAFYAGAVLAYLRWVAARAAGEAAARWYAAALLAFALALAAKPMAVSLPVVLLVLDAYPLRRLAGWRTREGRAVLLEKVPFALLALAASAVAVAAMASAGPLTPLASLGVPERVAVSLYGVAFYLAKTAAPVRLSPLYALPPALDPWASPFVVAAVLTLAMSALALVAWRRWPGLGAAWWSYLVILAPVAGLVHNGPQIAADRYSYLATLPWAVAAGGALALLARALRPSSPVFVAVTLVALAAVVALAALAQRQVAVWRDSEALWQHAVATAPSAIAHHNLAVVLGTQRRWTDVVLHARAALRFDPDLAEAHDDLGVGLERLDRLDEAAGHFREALRLRPDLASAHNHLGVVRGRQGRFAEATVLFRRAIELRPDYHDAERNLGLTLERMGKPADARAHLERAAALRQAR
jgi:tetratricopeptide (TPR) repeat protein